MVRNVYNTTTIKGATYQHRTAGKIRSNTARGLICLPMTVPPDAVLRRLVYPRRAEPTSAKEFQKGVDPASETGKIGTVR